MTDHRGCIDRIRRLHEHRMALYAKPDDRLSHNEIDTINEIDAYLDGLSSLLWKLDDISCRAADEKRGQSWCGSPDDDHRTIEIGSWPS